MKFLYLKLSKKVENNCKSKSIINQKIILSDFINNTVLNVVSTKINDRNIIIDFKSLAFKKMIKDIKNRKILMINLLELLIRKIVVYEYKTVQITFNYSQMEKYLKYAI